MPLESAPDRPRLAIVLAGGSGRRLGVVDKPGLLVGGLSLLDIALAAVAPARTVVVGPARTVAPGVLQTTELPPGGGPAAGLVAGLSALGVPAGRGSARRESGRHESADDLVAVLAADLPGMNATVIGSLTAALLRAGVDGVVLVDPDGRTQYLAGVWRWRALLTAAASRPSWDGARVSELLGPLIGARLAVDRATAADVDTPADLAQWGVQMTGPGGADGGDCRAPRSAGDDGVVR